MKQMNIPLPAILRSPPKAEVWLQRILSPLPTEEGLIDCEYIRAPIGSLFDLHAELGGEENEEIAEFRASIASCLMDRWDAHFESEFDAGSRLMERVEGALLKVSPTCKRALRYERSDTEDGGLVHVIKLTQMPPMHPQELEVQGWLEWNGDLGSSDLLTSHKSRQRLERRVSEGSVIYTLVNILDEGRGQGGGMYD